jgi:hypothetical protein
MPGLKKGTGLVLAVVAILFSIPAVIVGLATVFRFGAIVQANPAIGRSGILAFLGVAYVIALLAGLPLSFLAVLLNFGVLYTPDLSRKTKISTSSIVAFGFASAVFLLVFSFFRRM